MAGFIALSLIYETLNHLYIQYITSSYLFHSLSYCVSPTLFGVVATLSSPKYNIKCLFFYMIVYRNDNEG